MGDQKTFGGGPEAWQGADPETGFQLVKMPDRCVVKVADLVGPDHQARVQTAGSYTK